MFTQCDPASIQRATYILVAGFATQTGVGLIRPSESVPVYLGNTWLLHCDCIHQTATQ